MSSQKENISKEEWKKLTKFDSIDWGWIIMSIGMAIGAGIVFLPIQVGLVGCWVFLLSAIIGYPGMYLFQKLFINTLCNSEQCTTYPGVISHYLGKNFGFFLGILYFLMIIIWIFIYSTAINNDSATFIQTFHLSEHLLSKNPLYGLIVVCILVSIASLGVKILFKISTLLVLTKLLVILFLGIFLIKDWDIHNISAFPSWGYLIKETIVTLPFTLTSILFLQSLSPMVISYRSYNKSKEVARYKALRAMNISFFILFVVVFFYAVSFNLAIPQKEIIIAHEKNISALALIASNSSGITIKIFSLILNMFAVITAFFSTFLGFEEGCLGIVVNILKRFINENKINFYWVKKGILLFGILISWFIIIVNAPVLSFTSISSPLFGIIGCLLPAYLVHKVPELNKHKGIGYYYVIFTGILLVLSPFFAFL